MNNPLREQELFVPSNLPARRDSTALAPRKGLHRDPEGGKLAGVCSGLAQSTPVPAVVWRLAFVLTTLVWGMGIPAYAFLWFAMDKAPKRVVPEPTPDDLSPEDKEIWDAVQNDMESLGLRNDK